MCLEKMRKMSAKEFVKLVIIQHNKAAGHVNIDFAEEKEGQNEYCGWWNVSSVRIADCDYIVIVYRGGGGHTYFFSEIDEYTKDEMIQFLNTNMKNIYTSEGEL